MKPPAKLPPDRAHGVERVGPPHERARSLLFRGDHPEHEREHRAEREGCGKNDRAREEQLGHVALGRARAVVTRQPMRAARSTVEDTPERGMSQKPAAHAPATAPNVFAA